MSGCVLFSAVDATTSALPHSRFFRALGVACVCSPWAQPTLTQCLPTHPTSILSVGCACVCVCTALRVPSQRVPDLDALAGRLLRRHASLLDLVKVYNLVRVLPSVVSTLKVR